MSPGEDSSWDSVHLKRSPGMILQPHSNESFQHSPQHLQSSPETCPSGQREAGGRGGGERDANQPLKCLRHARQNPLQPPPPSPSAARPLQDAPRKQPCLLGTPWGRGRAGCALPGIPAGLLRLLGLESHPAAARLCRRHRQELSAASAAAATRALLVAAPATFLAWAETLPGPWTTLRAASHGRDDCTESHRITES